MFESFFLSMFLLLLKDTQKEKLSKATATLPKDFAFGVIKQAHMVTHDDTDSIASHLFAKCDRKKALKTP